MTETTLSVQQLLSFGWGQFKRAPWMLPGIIVVALGISIVSSLVLGEFIEGENVLLGSVAWVADFVIQIFIGMGFIALALKAHDAIEALEVDDLWAPEHFWRYLGASILTGIIVLIGFLLLIVPGLIAAVMLIFTPYLVVDKRMGPIEAMKKSREITRGNRWQLFFLMIALTIINIIGALVFLVGLLVTIPISILATAHAYRLLADNTPAQVSEA